MDEQQKQETEARIFEAAVEVFAQKGESGARMQEIADRAGLNKSLLHYYYRSKERLYGKVFEFVKQRFMGSLNTALQEAPTFEDALRAFIDRYIDTLASNPHFIRIMVHENLSGGHTVGAKFREMMLTEPDTPVQIFMRRMQAAIDAGEIRPVDPFQTFVTILGSSVFPFLAYPTLSVVHPEATADKEAFIAARKQHLFDLIFEGLRI